MKLQLLGRPPGGRVRALLLEAAWLALGSDSRRRGELCVVLIGDKEIRRINRDFLGHDRTTDVLAFRHEPLRGKPGRSETPPFGDVCVSLDTAGRQARELGHGLSRELATLVTHGVLHLRGYDDRRPADRRRMFARQEKLVDSLFRRRARSRRG
ncbi:MAG: rRNA maturation RNase YbeY [Elusimicrobiota bacterium]